MLHLLLVNRKSNFGIDSSVQYYNVGLNCAEIYRHASCSRHVEERCGGSSIPQADTKGGPSSGKIFWYIWMKFSLLIRKTSGCIERGQFPVLGCCRGKQRWGCRRIQTSASFPFPGWGMWLFPSILPSGGPSWSPLSKSRTPNTGKNSRARAHLLRR